VEGKQVKREGIFSTRADNCFIMKIT